MYVTNRFRKSCITTGLIPAKLAVKRMNAFYDRRGCAEWIRDRIEFTDPGFRLVASDCTSGEFDALKLMVIQMYGWMNFLSHAQRSDYDHVRSVEGGES